MPFDDVEIVDQGAVFEAGAVSWRRVLWALPLVFVLAGCDTAAQYSAAKIRVIVFDDGTAEMSWSLEGEFSDQQMADYGSGFAASLGLPEATSATKPGRASFVGLPTDSFTLDVETLLETVERRLPGLWPSVFVAVCTPSGQGRVEAEGMEAAHWGSCAVVDQEVSAVDARPSATVHLGRHWHPASTWLLVAAGAFVTGLLSAGVAVRSRGGWFLLLWSSVGVVMVGVCLSISSKSFGGSRSDPFLDTGLVFDEGMDDWFAAVAFMTGAMSLVLAISLVVSAITRHQRNRQSDDAR